MVRIALIGLSGYSFKDDQKELVSFSWNKLVAIKNVADFDQVIVHLPTLRDSKKLTRESFASVFNISNLADILKNGGRFIVIGDPRIEVFPDDPIEPHASIRDRILRSTYGFSQWTWLGMQWDTRQCTAQQTDYADYHDRNAFDRYLSSLTSCDFSLNGLNPDLSQIVEAFGLGELLRADSNTQLSIYRNPFCTSRYRTMLSGEIGFELVKVDPRYSRTLGVANHDVVAHFGSIVLLPETSLGHDEAMRILLEDAYGIQMATLEPEWVHDYKAPNQNDIDDELSELQAQALSLLARREELDNQRKEVRAPLRLLYGQHKDLEVAVLDMLQRLGAAAEPLVESNQKDGWITVMIDGVEQHAVLEVKSKRKGEFDLAGLRQLSDWQNAGIAEKGVKAKQLFVGNASADILPDDRAFPFGANFHKEAMTRDAIAIRSQDLYKVYELVQNGALDPTTFWQNLFTKSGVLKLEELVT